MVDNGVWRHSTVNDVPYEFVQAGGYFGPTFTAVFFFENVFWRVVIPRVYGAVSVNTMASLIAMPASLRQRLVQNAGTRKAFTALWADSIDYDMGRDYLMMQPHSDPAFELVTSVDRDLQSTIADLSQERPNSNAMHNARTTTEKALKAFLCLRHGYTTQAVKKQFQHDLEKAAAAVVARAPQSELAQVQPYIPGFAPYADRYTDRQYSRPELWTAYRCAQFAASSLMRCLTPFNQRSAMVSAATPCTDKEDLLA
jgi:hypothetical protein